MKERLVGAAVLMAAAVILVPEMLSGPEPEEAPAEAAAQPDAPPLKTYTIDLSPSSSAQTAAASMEERAPPPEAQLPVPEEAAETAAEREPSSTIQGNPEPPVEQSSRNEPAPVAAKPALRQAAPAPKPEEVASTRTVPASSGWAVQLGSFSKQETAERLTRDLRAQGHSAFVMPVRSRGTTLYRVRIGPMKDRAGAEALLARVRAKTPNAAVVPHP